MQSRRFKCLLLSSESSGATASLSRRRIPPHIFLLSFFGWHQKDFSSPQSPERRSSEELNNSLLPEMTECVEHRQRVCVCVCVRLNERRGTKDERNTAIDLNSSLLFRYRVIIAFTCNRIDLSCPPSKLVSVRRLWKLLPSPLPSQRYYLPQLSMFSPT